MSHLFSPATLRGLTLRNRTVVAPMCQYSAVDGMASDYHLVHLGRFALGGFGAVMVEASAVTRDGRISYGDMGIWSDAHIAPLARIATFLKQHGAAPAIQLAHAGRKGSSRRPWDGGGGVGSPEEDARGESAWPIVGPTSEAHGEGFHPPHALDDAGLDDLRKAYADAATRALKAGFEIAEVHCAHGYLLNQFLSPAGNTRTDRYGGSLENRMRFPLEIVDIVRATWPQELPLFVRISSIDGVAGGWTIEDSVAFARELKAHGVDVVDCSSGGFAGARFPIHPGYQVPHAETVKRETGIATMAVGLINDPQEAEALIADGKADLVAFAREALFEPNWAVRAQHVLEGDEAYATWPLQSGYAVRAQAKMLGDPAGRGGF